MSKEKLEIFRAHSFDLDDLVLLFDGYRVFYEQDSDLIGARKFLKSHFENQTSIIFIARLDGVAIGFTQLYRSFSSVSMQEVYILNDLFVDKKYRGKKAGELLLLDAQKFAKETGAKGLSLETGIDNPAQKLYEKLGWKTDDAYLHYSWLNKKSIP